MAVGRPIPQVDYPGTFQELLDWFPDDEACLDYLAKLRWADGFACPRCGVAGEAWRTGRGLWMCRACGRKTSVTAGTIFHGTRTPLTTWFAACVRDLAEERSLGAGSAAGAGVRLV